MGRNRCFLFILFFQFQFHGAQAFRLEAGFLFSAVLTYSSELMEVVATSSYCSLLFLVWSIFISRKLRFLSSISILLRGAVDGR